MTLTITNGIKNPVLGVQSSAFQFRSQIVDGGNTYLIDEDTTTLKITPTVYGEFTNVQVKRVDSFLVNIVTAISIKATSTNPIPANSIVTIGIPTGQFQLSGAAVSFYLADANMNKGAAIRMLLTISISLQRNAVQMEQSVQLELRM